MKSLREKEKLLEATIQADGLEGVRNFYTAKSEYVEKEEEIGDAWRRLKALVQ